MRGVICKCTQNCRRRGAAVGPRTSATEVEKKKKNNRRCACSHYGIFHVAPVEKHFQWTMQTGKHKIGKVAPSLTARSSHHYQQQKALFKPKLGVERRGGCCVKLARSEQMETGSEQTRFQNNSVNVGACRWHFYFESRVMELPVCILSDLSMWEWVKEKKSPTPRM